ncbi:MAG: GGDEF domain-containing protein [Lachnospiraceae bacterium]|nr:GGDEF domain-containing protein [Lachnospiraceae bacterium]
MKKNHHDVSNKIKKIGTGNLVGSLLMAVFFVSLSILFYVFLHNSIKENIKNQDMLMAKESIALYEQYLSKGMDLVEFESSLIKEMIANGDQNDSLLTHMTTATDIIIEEVDSDSTGLYGYIGGEYLDGAGWVPDAGYDPTTRPWYQSAMIHRGKLTFVDPYMDAQTGNVMMTLAKTLGQSSDVIALDMSLGDIQQITEEHSDVTGGQLLMLVDSSGSIIAHPDTSRIGFNCDDNRKSLEGFIISMILQGKTGYFETMFAGEQYMVYTEKMEGYWYCISVTEAGDSFRILRVLLAITTIVIIATLFICSLLFINLSQGKANTDTLNQRLSTAADIYMSVHDIDVMNDRMCAIKIDEKENDALPNPVKARYEPQDMAQEHLYSAMDLLTDEMSRPMVHDFVNLSTLDERMKDTNTIAVEYMNNNNIWCRARFIVSEHDEDGRISDVLLLFEQIDAEKRNRDKLLYMSETDMMTGISNRSCGERKIKDYVAHGQNGMFMLIDIDKFKCINDNFGHGVGDRVIIAVAHALKNAFRSTDVVMRLGGDEFAAFARGVTSAQAAGYIVDRLLSNIREINIPEIGDHEICVSAGVSFYTHDDMISFDELYTRADHCTYASKEHDGTYVSYYEN